MIYKYYIKQDRNLNMKNKKLKISFLIMLLVLLVGFVSASNITDDYEQKNISEKCLIKDDSNSLKSGVKPSSTVLSIDPIQDTCYTDKVNIQGTLKSDDGTYLTNTYVNIDVNGAKYKNITNNEGKFSLKYITRTVGKNNVSISFNENNYYKSSSTTTSFNVIPQVTKITLNSIPKTMFSDVVTISGRYTDKNNVVLRFTPISIIINNQKFTTDTDKNGLYNLDYKTRVVGVNNISVSYPGNNRYQNDKFNSTFIVIPKNTKLTINNINTCQYNDTVIVTGKYTDISDNNLRNTPLILRYGNKQIVNSTNEEGKFSFVIKATQIGNNDISISYPGNTRYAGTTATKTLTVSAKDTILTINKINTIEYADYVVLSGKYTDKDGNNLRYTPLNIEINNKNYLTSTDGNGIFNYKIKTNKIGINKGQIYFKGNIRYNTTKRNFSFNVTPKSTKIKLNQSTINNSRLYVSGRFTDTNNYRLRNTPLNIIISFESNYVKSMVITRTRVLTDADGYFKYNCKISDSGIYTTKVSFNGNQRYCANSSEVKTVNKGKSRLFVNSIQGVVNQSTALEVNVTDELNNSVKSGKISLYLNNKLIETKNVFGSKNIMNIPPKSIGVYDLKVVYSSDYYNTSNKIVKLSINPKNNYNIKLLWNPAITNNLLTKISGHIRVKGSASTLNSGEVKFYLNDKYLGKDSVKNNLSYVRFNVTYPNGDYSARIDYYNGGKFMGSDSEIIHIRKQDPQVSQNTYITLSSDLITNSLITSAKKDVYFAMDRTTNSNKDYSPNDMKIMNGIANTLRTNGFNVKTVRNGPGETYNTARYMYNNKIKNSICFILCNGVDANVIREYLYGNDGILTAVRKRGNDIVLGWFYGAGNIYDPDGEYYYYLKKAWDDNYSGKGGISNPRKTMERDGIKIVYERNDLTGQYVADSLIRLYRGTVSKEIKNNSTISLKTVLYTTNNNKISGGNIVYTLNGKIITNVTVTGNSYTLKYKLPNIKGNYNLKATYYLNNKPVCTSWERNIQLV